MTIAAKVSATELTKIIEDRYVGQYFEARLIKAEGFVYDPGVTGSDTDLLDREVAIGRGGYQRAVLNFASGDIGAYADGGVALNQKATVFAHDGVSPDAIEFTHVALVWSEGNVTKLSLPTSAPDSATNTVSDYTNIPVDTDNPNSTGTGMTVDLEVINNGQASTDYIVKLNKPGIGYTAGEIVKITNANLLTLDPDLGSGDLAFTVDGISNPPAGSAGKLFTVAKTGTTVSLEAGNEAAFYWNVKQFGFYTTFS